MVTTYNLTSPPSAAMLGGLENMINIG